MIGKTQQERLNWLLHWIWSADGEGKLPPNLEFARETIELLLVMRPQMTTTRVPVLEPVEYTIAPDGIITARPWLMDILSGADANRLRRCEVCQKIFYATREKSRGCSKRCAATLRKRRSYDLQRENREVYKTRRRKKGTTKKGTTK